MVKILETERLVLRELTTDDSAFILELLNEPQWLEYIGDKNVKTLEDAKNYLINGPIQMYLQCGFGHWVIETKVDSTLVGIAGLIKRDWLDHVDIGYALLNKYCGFNYAYEACSAIISYANLNLGLSQIIAIVSPLNQRSTHLLNKLGFSYEKTIKSQIDSKDLLLMSQKLASR